MELLNILNHTYIQAVYISISSTNIYIQESYTTTVGDVTVMELLNILNHTYIQAVYISISSTNIYILLLLWRDVREMMIG